MPQYAGELEEHLSWVTETTRAHTAANLSISPEGRLDVPEETKMSNTCKAAESSNRNHPKVAGVRYSDRLVILSEHNLHFSCTPLMLLYTEPWAKGSTHLHVVLILQHWEIPCFLP